VEASCGGAEDCGESEDALERSVAALKDCAAVVCARIGLAPWERLEAAGIGPNGEHGWEAGAPALAAGRAEMLASGGAAAADRRRRAG
jgi:nitrogen fixation protein NifB